MVISTRILRAAAAWAVAAFFVAPIEAVRAHGIEVARNADGELRVVVEVPSPIQLQPSPFPGIFGWADAEPGFASAEIDEPDEDLFRLDPNCDIQFELVAFDPGIQIVTSHAWVPGETFDFGAPFFDYHLVFNIYDGAIGSIYALQFRVRDLNGIHPGNPLVTLFFTPVETVCACRGDTDADTALTGADVQSFVACLLDSASGDPPGPQCACADMDADGALDGADVDMFIARLLAADACP